MLDAILRRYIRSGSLHVTWPNGITSRYGEDGGADCAVAIRLVGCLTPLRLGLHPDLYLGQAYMNGTLRLERGNLWDFMTLLARNMRPHCDGPLFRPMQRALNRIFQRNSRDRSRKNAKHHYDLSNDLYRLFLDEDLQYSCAYFSRPDLDLEAAQAAKKRHLAAKLLLRPRQRVLDVGCGWGGLALSLAEFQDVEVLGITLSSEQLEVARTRAVEAGLADRVKFELADFRDVSGRFDRIISVGMFEHVGTRYYPEYFERIRDLLSPEGIAVVHSIGRMRGPSTTSHWIRKYIFPGGYIPALSEVLPSVERSGLWVADLEILRLHYANTLALWRERYQANRPVIESMYDARFARMWEFYLVSSEMSFRYAGFMVFQMQLSKQVHIPPITRDYLVAHEHKIAGHARTDPSMAECSVRPVDSGRVSRPIPDV